MSDLISRSQLLKEIETWGGCVEALHEYIQKMPTAYDIDKVVEELEKESKRWEDSGKEYEDKCEIAVGTGLRYAIEIVKHGGVNDVCEWECKYINNKYVYSTSCDNIFIYETDSRNCPYCGKKIKVVE